MRRKMMTCFMIIFIPCFVSGCSNKTIKKWSDQVKDDIVKDAESQGITIDIPSNDEKEKISKSKNISICTITKEKTKKKSYSN